MEYEVRLKDTGMLVGVYRSISDQMAPAGTELTIAKDITAKEERWIKAWVYYSLVPIGEGQTKIVPVLLVDAADALVTLPFFIPLKLQEVQ